MSAMTEQKACFDLFGFLYFPRLFASEAEAMTRAFEAVWSEHGAATTSASHGALSWLRKNDSPGGSTGQSLTGRMSQGSGNETQWIAMLGMPTGPR